MKTREKRKVSTKGLIKAPTTDEQGDQCSDKSTTSHTYKSAAENKDMPVFKKTKQTQQKKSSKTTKSTRSSVKKMNIKGKKGKKAISSSSRTKASYGKNKTTKSKLAPKSKQLKKVHQKYVDEIHPKKDQKREKYQTEIDLVNQKKIRKKEGHQPLIDIKKENEKRLIIANRSKGSYQCFECDEIFRHLPDLCSHLFKHPKAVPRLCENCGTGFISATQLNCHIAKRNRQYTEMLYECDVCSLGFTNQFLLEFHKEAHKAPHIVQCGKCDEGFESGSSFLRHYELSHHLTDFGKRNTKKATNKKLKECEWHCSICKAIFNSPSDLCIHMLTHSQNNTFICVNCGVGYYNMTYQMIMQHKTAHEKKAFHVNIQCDVCDEYFTEPELLSVHMKTHYGYYYYDCRVCKESFKEGHLLLNHLNDPEVKCQMSEAMQHQMENEEVNQDQTKDITSKIQTSQMETGNINICSIRTGRKCYDTNSTELSNSSESRKTNDEDINGVEEQTIDLGNHVSCLSFYSGKSLSNNSLCKNNMNIFKCLTCNNSYKNYLSLYCHLDWHGFRQIFICNNCGVGMETLQKYDGHRLQHIEEKDELLYECSECEERFLYEKLLSRHHEIVHKGRELLYCESCKCGFQARKKAIEHRRIHREGKIGTDKQIVKSKCRNQIFKCQFCPLQNSSEYQIRLHVKTKHRLVCHSCRESFETHELLRMHVRNHTEDYPYRCGLCGYSYNAIEDLSHHINIHMIKEKDWFVCRICPQKFLNEENFQEHTKEHVCEYCQLTIKIKENFEIHRENCSETGGLEIVRVCPFCSEGFKSLYWYAKHFSCYDNRGKFVCDLSGLDRKNLEKSDINLVSVATENENIPNEIVNLVEENSIKAAKNRNLYHDKEAEEEPIKTVVKMSDKTLANLKTYKQLMESAKKTNSNIDGQFINQLLKETKEIQEKNKTATDCDQDISQDENNVNFQVNSTAGNKLSPAVKDRILAKLLKGRKRDISKVENSTSPNKYKMAKTIPIADDSASEALMAAESHDRVNHIDECNSKIAQVRKKRLSPLHISEDSERGNKRLRKQDEKAKEMAKNKCTMELIELSRKDSIEVSDGGKSPINDKHLRKSKDVEESQSSTKRKKQGEKIKAQKFKTDLATRFSKNSRKVNNKTSVDDTSLRSKTYDPDTIQDDQVENLTEMEDQSTSVDTHGSRSGGDSEDDQNSSDETLSAGEIEFDGTNVEDVEVTQVNEMSSGSLRKSSRKKISSIKAKMLNERGCDLDGRKKKMATENNGTPTKSDNYQQDLNDSLTSTENEKIGFDAEENKLVSGNHKNKLVNVKTGKKKKRSEEIFIPINETSDKIYRCSHCEVMFSNYRHLYLHIRSHHQLSKVMLCFSCGLGTGCRHQDLKKMEVKYCHKAADNNDVTDFPYVCTTETENFRCDQRSKSKELLALHVNLEHNDIPLFECDQCDKKLRFIGGFINHYIKCFKKKCVQRLREKNCNKQNSDRGQELDTENVHVQSIMESGNSNKNLSIRSEKLSETSNETDNAVLELNKTVPSMGRYVEMECDQSGLLDEIPVDDNNGIKSDQEFDQLNTLESKNGHSTCSTTDGNVGGDLVNQETESLTIDNRKQLELELDFLRQVFHEKSILKGFGLGEDGNYKCEICGDRLNDYTDFYEHLKGHPGENSFICLACGKGNNLSELGRRKWTDEHTTCIEHKKCSFSCGVCQSEFYNVELLKWHERLHQGKGLLVCKGCGQDFAEAKCFKDHQESHNSTCQNRSDESSTAHGDETLAIVNMGNPADAKLKENMENPADVKLKENMENLADAKLKEKRLLQRQKLLKIKHKFDLARKLLGPARIHKPEPMRVEKEKKPNPVKGINCSVCDRFFKTGSFLCEHGRSSSSYKLPVCKECGRVFSKNALLQMHMTRKHNTDKSYMCHVCHFAFGNRTDMRRHLKLIHGIQWEPLVEKVAADHCYMTPPKESKHIEKEDVRYIPDLKSNVNDSSRPDDYIIKRDGKYVCKICGLVSKNISIKSLRFHVMHKHLSKKTHHCPVCNYSCAFKGLLKRHIETCHEEEQECQICKKILTSKRGLQLHIEKNHKESFIPELKIDCKICGECFRYRKELIDHKLQFHANIRYDCDICGQSLASARGLRKHTERIHGNDGKESRKTNKSTYPVGQVPATERETHHAVAYIQEFFKKSPAKKVSKQSPISHPDIRKPPHQEFFKKLPAKEVSKLSPISHPDILKPPQQMQTKCQEKRQNFENYNVIEEREEITTQSDENNPTYQFFICQTCGSVHMNEMALMKHIRENHITKIWTCNICDLEVLSLSNATKHRLQNHIGITSNTICFTEKDGIPQNNSIPVDDDSAETVGVNPSVEQAIDDTNVGQIPNLSTNNIDNKLYQLVEEILTQEKSQEDQRDFCGENQDMNNEVTVCSENEIGHQISSSNEKLFPSDIPSTSSTAVTTLWNTFAENGTTEMGDNSVSADGHVIVLNDMDVINEAGIYTQTGLELSPIKKFTKIDAAGFGSGRNSNNMLLSTALLNRSISENDTEIESSYDNDNEEGFLDGQNEMTKVETETPNEIKSMIQKDFTRNEIDIASSLLKLDTPTKPNLPNRTDMSSSLNKSTADSMPAVFTQETIENEVVIETSAVENVIIEKDNREKSFPVTESIGTQFPNNENNTQSGIGSDNSSAVLDNNELGSKTNNPQDESDVTSKTDKNDAIKIRPGSGKFDSNDKIHEVINVPRRLTKPFQTMINLPDNEDETQNTVVNLPDNVKSVDLTVANMDSDDGDVYLLFFV